jgi:hypothetical protein
MFFLLEKIESSLEVLRERKTPYSKYLLPSRENRLSILPCPCYRHVHKEPNYESKLRVPAFIPTLSQPHEIPWNNIQKFQPK